MMFKKRSSKNLFWIILLLLICIVAACGGGDEAVEETTSSESEALDEALDSEAIEDNGMEATGSEEDSGEIPPTPEPGSKVATARTTPSANPEITTANPNAPVSRIESGETAVTLELVLLLDTTGSMSNEITQLQASLPNLVTNLGALTDGLNLRLGLVTYGDQEKQASVQIFEFTEEITLFAENIASLTAVGGGDYPEEMNSGFYQTVTALNWQAESQKLIIIIGDAPPKTDNPNIPGYEEISIQAAAQNITIFAVGSKGLDASGAAVFSQIAQNGNGRFFYLTDNSETSPQEATAVYPANQIGNVLLEIIQEVLDE